MICGLTMVVQSFSTVLYCSIISGYVPFGSFVYIYPTTTLCHVGLVSFSLRIWGPFFPHALILLGAFPVVAIAHRDYVIMLWDQISALQALPEDAACPMLCKDPLSDWVLWLA